MRQSRVMSLVEAVANVVVGYGVAVGVQIILFPVFGLGVYRQAEPRHWAGVHGGVGREELFAPAYFRVCALA